MCSNAPWSGGAWSRGGAGCLRGYRDSKMASWWGGIKGVEGFLIMGREEGGGVVTFEHFLRLGPGD